MEYVTDRTEEDVLLGNAKGLYTPTDLNRVEANVKELSKMATELAVYFSPVTKTDWSRMDLAVDQLQAERYISNIKKLASACGVSVTLPESLDKLNWNSANNIEKSLQMVRNRIIAVTSTFNYSGEFFAGEEYL